MARLCGGTTNGRIVALLFFVLNQFEICGGSVLRLFRTGYHVNKDPGDEGPDRK